jgi:predicted component of type VI protein secretion system
LKENNNYKSVHLVTLYENEKVVLGRSNDTDVRINDISVSRSHCCLSFTNKKIFLKDMKSKFGTLLLVQGEIELSSTKKMSLQVGRTYIESCFTQGRENKSKEK